ncbi:amino acid:polyamine antiporter [Streptomyces hokutonensis]|uniref:amino acid:polyamine antiporter n=1 Tax=Streptomyces hokutonensis TaxID=1306990 RepID=UPI0036A324E8
MSRERIEHPADTGARTPPARDPQLRPDRAGTAIAGGVAREVLGAGMVIMPAVVADLTGDGSLRAWTVHILLGGTVSLLLALLVHGTTRSLSLAATAGATLGPRAAGLVNAVFAAAFTAGQGAIAWFAATCVQAAAKGTVQPPGQTGLLIALGVLSTALALALSPLRLPAAVLRARPWAAGAVALGCAACAWPDAPGPDAHTPLVPSSLQPGAAFWLAVAALFFAGVGWEAVTSVVPGAPTTASRTAAGVGLGVAVVAAVYLGLAAVRSVADGAGVPEPPAAWVRWTLAGAVLVVLTSYCLTNIRTAARIAAELRPDAAGPRRPLVAAVGALCCAFAVIGARDGSVPLLLLGPAVAAVTGYAAGAVAALRRGGPLLRCGAVVVLLALAATAVQTTRSLLPG